MYQNIIKVPLILSSKSIEGCKKVQSLVSNVDIVPTILSFIGDDPSGYSLQGEPLIPLKEQYHDFVIAEKGRMDDSKHEILHRRAVKAIIAKDHYKYIKYSDGQMELFDLNNDPDEEMNIFEEKRDIANSMDQKLIEWLDSIEHRDTEAHEAEFDDEVREELEKLGYL